MFNKPLFSKFYRNVIIATIMVPVLFVVTAIVVGSFITHVLQVQDAFRLVHYIFTIIVQYYTL